MYTKKKRQMDWSLPQATMVPPCKHVSVKSTSLTDEQGKGLGGKVNDDRNNQKGRCQDFSIGEKDLNSDLNKMPDQGE